MTLFSLLIQACGLSLGEAAAFLGVRKDTAASWSTGRRTAGPDVLGQLRALYRQIQTAADGAIDALSSAPEGAEIEIGYPADDHEAQALGFPCVGAWRAMAAIVIGELAVPVQIVPRGSTPATAAAADAHQS
jgi:hypothetical protein